LAQSDVGRKADIRYCRVCAYPMPAGAKKCTKCDTWTTRRWVTMTQTTLTLLIALFAVLGTLIPQFLKLWSRESETRVAVVSGDSQDLIVAVSNSGSRTSALRTYHVEFVNMGLPAMELHLMNSSPIASPNAESRVKLRAENTPLASCQKRSFENWIANGVMKLTVQVQESSDAGDVKKTTPREDVIAAKYVKGWINEHIDWKEQR
jgi:hypothetical protein